MNFVDKYGMKFKKKVYLKVGKQFVFYRVSAASFLKMFQKLIWAGDLCGESIIDIVPMADFQGKSSPRNQKSKIRAILDLAKIKNSWCWVFMCISMFGPR